MLLCLCANAEFWRESKQDKSGWSGRQRARVQDWSCGRETEGRKQHQQVRQEHSWLFRGNVSLAYNNWITNNMSTVCSMQSGNLSQDEKIKDNRIGSRKRIKKRIKQESLQTYINKSIFKWKVNRCYMKECAMMDPLIQGFQNWGLWGNCKEWDNKKIKNELNRKNVKLK